MSTTEKDTDTQDNVTTTLNDNVTQINISCRNGGRSGMTVRNSVGKRKGKRKEPPTTITNPNGKWDYSVLLSDLPPSDRDDVNENGKEDKK